MADDAHAHIALDQLIDVAAEIGAEQAHQSAHLGLGPLPIFGGEGEQGQVFQPHVATGAHGFAHGGHAGIMSGFPRQVALLRPAAIAVHDDGDMLGKGSGKIAQRGYTCMISCSLEWSEASMSLIWASVSFCSSSALVCCSSWPILSSF